VNKFYECKQTQIYLCKKKNEKMAWDSTLSWLELEINKSYFEFCGYWLLNIWIKFMS
jgi:hypothetical protein